MSKKLNNKKIITAIVLVFCINGCTINRTSSFSKSLLNNDRRTPIATKLDANNESKVITMLSNNEPLWDSSHISAASYNQSLLLIGQTSSEQNLKIIEKIVAQIPEVDTIHNEVKVRKPISFKTRAKDAWITTQVKAKLLSEPSIGTNRIKVYTEDGVVYLMGILTKYEEETVTATTISVGGVTGVVKILDILP